MLDLYEECRSSTPTMKLPLHPCCVLGSTYLRHPCPSKKEHYQQREWQAPWMYCMSDSCKHSCYNSGWCQRLVLICSHDHCRCDGHPYYGFHRVRVCDCCFAGWAICRREKQHQMLCLCVSVMSCYPDWNLACAAAMMRS